MGVMARRTSKPQSPPLHREEDIHTNNVIDNNTTNRRNHNISPPPSPPRRESILFSARGKSVLYMSISLAIHLGGYELSRAAVMALFTSDKLGFGKGKEGGLSALPMAVGCVSPFAVLLLWFYAKTLDVGGPSFALRTHTLICAGTQIVSGWILKAFDDYLQLDETKQDTNNLIFRNVKGWSQPLLFMLFVFQNAYVQLLYNQHWAFISSILTAEEGAKAFAPIAGLGSIGSTLAAGSVSVFIGRFGLIGLLHMAGISYIFSAILADCAFEKARRNGFEPSKYNSKSTIRSTEDSKGDYEQVNSSESKDHTAVKEYNKRNIYQQAYALFNRVPVLGALFLEVIVSQCLSSLVNFIYLYKLKATIIDDGDRASWAGNFYAWINGVSGILQFFGLNLLLRYCKAHRIWLFMPVLMLCCTIYTFATSSSSSSASGLFGTSASFFAIKVMEYSLRVAANESLYVSLDYESRYLGKKVISLGAGKFGKSTMALALSFVMIMYGEKEDIIWYLLLVATLFTILWLVTSIRLHSLVERSL